MALDAGGSRFDNRGSAAAAAVPRKRNLSYNNTGSIPAPIQREPTSFSPYGSYEATIPGPSQYEPGYAPWSPEQQPGYGGGGYGGGGGGSIAPIAPVAPPKPPPSPKLTADDFAAKYKGNDKGLAITDSTFGDQASQYANILQKYIEDYTRQSGSLTKDTATAQAGIALNKENGLTSQAEDFAARGLGNSGLFAKEQQRASDQYSRQKANVEKSRLDQQGTLDFNKSKMQTENGANGSNIQNARREAYNRLALKQALA